MLRQSTHSMIRGARQKLTPYSRIGPPHFPQNSLLRITPLPLSASCTTNTFSPSSPPFPFPSSPSPVPSPPLPLVYLKALLGIFVVIPNGPPVKRLQFPPAVPVKDCTGDAGSDRSQSERGGAAWKKRENVQWQRLVLASSLGLSSVTAYARRVQ